MVHSSYLLYIKSNQPQGKLFIYLMLFPELEPIRLLENDARSVRFFQCLRSKKREDFMGLQSINGELF